MGREYELAVERVHQHLVDEFRAKVRQVESMLTPYLWARCGHGINSYVSVTPILDSKKMAEIEQDLLKRAERAVSEATVDGLVEKCLSKFQ